jgi:hypothetical protein
MRRFSSTPRAVSLLFLRLAGSSVAISATNAASSFDASALVILGLGSAVFELETTPSLREIAGPISTISGSWSSDLRSFTAAVRTLERTCAMIGYPRSIRVDQGSEFVSRDLDLWAYTNGVTLDFSRPGKPNPERTLLINEGKQGSRSPAWPLSTTA